MVVVSACAHFTAHLQVVKIIEISSMVMGEQTLSREYYYLGTQLLIGRFLKFLM